MSESEQTSLERYAGTRDAGAFRMLVERHQDMVFATCRRILRNPADAEDAAQNCFLQLASKAGQLRAPIAGWLHRVAVQASIDMLRRDQARKGREMRAAQGRAEDQAPSWDEVKGFVDEAMAGLPDRVRLPLILHYLEGRKQTEIAAELGITQSAVSKRLQQGVNVLRGQLKRGGFIFSAGVLAPLLVNNAAEAAPATLKAALGKMALSGMGATKATATAGTATAGGLTVVKSVIAVAAVSAITVGSVVAYKTMSGDAAPPPSKVQAPARQTAKPRPIVGPGAAVEKPPRPVKSLDLRIYDVRDVLLMSEKTGRAEGRSGPRSRARRIRLLKLIVQLTGAENWRSVCLESREGRSEKVGEVGEGAGLMVLREADLLVKQRDQVHKHIELIITALREQGLVQVNMAAKFISLSGQFIKEFDRPGSRRSSVPRLLSNLLSKRRKPSAGASGSATTFSEILDEATAKELVNAARKSPHARILQEPSVTTLNGEPAPVGVRSKIEFISSWKGGELRPIKSTVSAGSSLRVRPYASADRRYVTLFVKGEVSTVTFQEQMVELPPLTKGHREMRVRRTPVWSATERSEPVRSRSTVPDRGTLLIAGLTAVIEKEAERSVPALRDMPFIRRRTSHKSTVRLREHLIILVTPTILIRDEVEARIPP